jgi:hypothetical protein
MSEQEKAARASRLAGEVEPYLAEVEREIQEEWRAAPDTEARESKWHQMQAVDALRKRLRVAITNGEYAKLRSE